MLLDPLRLRILVLARQPASASEIAVRLALPRQSVDYHVRDLARARILRRAGRRDHHRVAGGHTLLRLVNSGFDESGQFDDEFEGTRRGWPIALEILKLYLENYFGQPRRTVLVLRPRTVSYDQLWPYYTRAEGLSQWFTSAGSLGGPGEPYRLRLRDGSTMSGRVLALAPGRNIAMTWTEIRGLAQFEAFKGFDPLGPMLCVKVTGWNLDSARAEELEAQLNSALDRLSIALGPPQT